METYLKIILDLENELSGMKSVSENVTDQREFAIGHCKIALDKLRKRVIENGFPDRQSEIRFFKELKPAAYGKLLFYQTVFDLESKRHKADVPVIRRYLEKWLFKIHEYMEVHHVKVQYYRCGFKHLDEQYFLRDNSEIPLELKYSHQLLDEEFFTWHDHTFSTIMANEMLIDYIQNELEKLEHSKLNENALPKSPLYWTGKKIDLVENLYCWYFSNSVNHGKATIKDLVKFIGLVLNIDLSKDVYKYYIEIQHRKIDQTKFLDYLKAVLIQKLDDKNK